jgi:C_GCAxxG_C_C family probable redox protein
MPVKALRSTVEGRLAPPRAIAEDIDDLPIFSAPIERAGERARAYFDSGYNCAQAVLLASAEVMSIDISPDTVKGMASFAGGIGYAGCTCGALAGASVFAGILMADEKRPRKNKKATDMSGKLHDSFKEHYKTTCCRALRKGRDFKDKETRIRCRAITANTAEMLIGLVDTSKAAAKAGGAFR